MQKPLDSIFYIKSIVNFAVGLYPNDGLSQNHSNRNKNVLKLLNTHNFSKSSDGKTTSSLPEKPSARECFLIYIAA